MKSLTFKQRLALAVHSSPKANSSTMPYGFEAMLRLLLNVTTDVWLIIGDEDY